MALLTDEQRDGVREHFEEDQSGIWAEIGCSGQAIRGAVNAIDQYFDDHAAEMNNALPAEAKAGLTQGQKAWITAYVALARYGVI